VLGWHKQLRHSSPLHAGFSAGKTTSAQSTRLVKRRRALREHNTALRDRRTNTALVRIVTWAAGGRDDTATATAVKFGQDLYPHMRQILLH
jgi:hypothetical protein